MKNMLTKKDAALNTLWNETEGKVDAGTWTSLENVYHKVGVSAGTKKQYRLFPLEICGSSRCVCCISVRYILVNKEYI